MNQQVSYTLAEIAEHIGAELKGDASKKISGIAPLTSANDQQLTFLYTSSAKSAEQLAESHAGAVIVPSADLATNVLDQLVVKDPRLAFAKAAQLFDHKKALHTGVHPSAVIAESSQIAPSVVIGANVSIGHYCTIGENTIIKANATIADYVTIGKNCIIHEGAVIGSDGFGNANEQGKWVKIPQLGCVQIHDDVEIGANSTVDCGAMGDTIIHNGVRIDNLVQIAHNVEIGAHTAIAAQAGVAGSTKIGQYCLIAGQAAVNGHVEVTDKVVITGQGMITNSIKKPGVYSSGTGFMANTLWRKMVVRLRGLDDLARIVKKLEKIVMKGEK